MRKTIHIALFCCCALWGASHSMRPRIPLTVSGAVYTKMMRGIECGGSAVAVSSFAGFVCAAMVFRKNQTGNPYLPAILAAAAMGYLSSITVAPYAAYKGGGPHGLLAYGTSLVLAFYAHYYIENKDRA